MKLKIKPVINTMGNMYSLVSSFFFGRIACLTRMNCTLIFLEKKEKKKITVITVWYFLKVRYKIMANRSNIIIICINV